MKRKKIDDIFDNFLKKKSLFTNKKVFQMSYTPDEVVHREEQINLIAGILAPALKIEKPSNLFIYGKTGTGKTLSVNYTTERMTSKAKEAEVPIKVIYVNCKLKKVADTEYRLIAHLIRKFGGDIAATGLPINEVYKAFFKAVDEKEQLIILILDEIDQLVGKIGDEILYTLTRINSDLKNGQISIIGISNDLVFTDTLDPRVRSSLSEEEIVFPPYNAIQIQHILKKRAEVGFRKECVSAGVIEKCAAYAAREHGDARRALELLRVAGDLAEREGKDKILIKHIDLAEDKIEKDRVIILVSTQPDQHKATLYSVFLLNKEKTQKQKWIFTGEIYEVYRDVCIKAGLRPLTQRRISDIIQELDMLGVINAKVVSKGRYGRTREISLGTHEQINKKIIAILEESLNIKN